MTQIDTGGMRARGPRATEDHGAPAAAWQPGSNGIKELRLGLVCYGGVSLAIYMHGVTVELQSLVRASVAYCHYDDPKLPRRNPFEEGTTERVYWDALNQVCNTGDKAALRVVIDVIAGTSAGGINGVVLAKALTQGLSQGPLRDVWFDKASLLKLLMHSPRQLFREGLRAPLNGEKMTRWAYEALTEMNQKKLDLPGKLQAVSAEDNHEVDLFVTTTDAGGYRRTLDLWDPERVHDTEYRHVWRFRFVPGGSDKTDNMFLPDWDPALTLAIRSTSSFPGAFPPVTLDELRKAIGPSVMGDTKLDERYPSLFASYRVENANPNHSYLVDGGVLNNHPFNHAIRAIVEHPADHEVERRLLFIEPHPVEPKEGPGSPPTWLGTVFRALSTIPSHQPVADAIADLGRHNQRALELRGLIKVVERGCWELISRVSKSLNLSPDRLRQLELDTINELAGHVQDEAKSAAGAAYAAYELIKTGEVVRDLADGICTVFDYPVESHPAALVRRLVQAWAQKQNLIGTADEVRDATEARIGFLQAYDINFRRRRLRFVIRSLNEFYRELYREGSGRELARKHLDEAKKGLYDLIKELRDIQSGEWVEKAEGLKRALEPLFGRDAIDRLSQRRDEPLDRRVERLDQRIEEHLTVHGVEFQHVFDLLGREVSKKLGEFNEKQKQGLEWLRNNPNLTDDVLQSMLKYYVGFAYWDTILYPLVAVSGLVEPDPVEVMRISSNDTRLLHPPTVEKRLKGVAVHHFGAFLKRAYRENDFLWGRLDAVERLLDLLDDVARRQSHGGTDKRAGGDAAKRIVDLQLAWRGFKSVLDTEEHSMTAKETKELVRSLREQVIRNLGS